MKKRIIVIIASFLIFVAVIAFIIIKFGYGLDKKDKITIYTTIYPEYDFVSHIVGNKMKVVRLIEPGIEIHTYEPSSKDMIRIAECDMFIYTGNDMEPWANKIIDSIKEYNVKIVDTSKNIDMIELDEFVDKYSLIDESDSEEHDHNESEKDGHIWLNPQNAITMIDTILDEIIKLDPQNEDYYVANAENYKKQILELDIEIEEKLKENNIDTLVFGGEFAYSYFCQRYNLGVVSCYTACGEHSEPSISRIKKVIEFINENKIKNIYYEELSEGQISQMISEETQANAKVFNTLHNISQEEIDNGEDYVSIMRDNLNKIIE